MILLGEVPAWLAGRGSGGSRYGLGHHFGVGYGYGTGGGYGLGFGNGRGNGYGTDSGVVNAPEMWQDLMSDLELLSHAAPEQTEASHE